LFKREGCVIAKLLLLVRSSKLETYLKRELFRVFKCSVYLRAVLITLILILISREVIPISVKVLIYNTRVII
jgi:hypothetical protein